MTEREQARFNQVVVSLISKINRRIDDCFANISASSSGGGGASYNQLINGGFDYAQRQVSTTMTTVADKKYGFDRWMMTRENADVQTVLNDGTGESGLTSSSFGTIYKITNTGKFMMLQPIIGVNSIGLRNQTQTFEIKMKASGNKTVRMAIIELQNAGTVDTLPAAVVTSWNANTVDPTLGANLAVVTSAESKSVTTAWQKFSVSKIIPATTKNVICAIWTDSQFTTNDTLSVAEAGLYASAPASWNERHGELALCQKYCQRPLEIGATTIVDPMAFRYSTNFIIGLGRLLCTMRTIPNFFNNISGWHATAVPTTTLMGAFNYNAAAAITIVGALTVAFDQTSTTQFRILLTAATSFSGTSGNICDIRFGPDVILYADAEIY